MGQLAVGRQLLVLRNLGGVSGSRTIDIAKSSLHSVTTPAPARHHVLPKKQRRNMDNILIQILFKVYLKCLNKIEDKIDIQQSMPE